MATRRPIRRAARLAPDSDTPDFFTGGRLPHGRLANQDVLEDGSDIWTQAIADGNLPESLASAFTFNGIR